MKYNFDEIIDRKNTGSLKWDVPDGELPMWVADMDFRTAPAVTEAIAERASHGIFGYTVVPDEWYEAYQSWWSSRHHFEIEKDWLIFCTGVVPAISSVVRKMTTVAEKVVVMTPVYNIFFNSILNNGRNVLESKLKLENGVYEIDFEDLKIWKKNFQIRRQPCCFCVIRRIRQEGSGIKRRWNGSEICA